MKRWITVLVLFLLLLIVGGCKQAPKVKSSIPPINNIKMQVAPKGDEMQVQKVNIVLYFVNKEKNKLVTQVREVQLLKNQSLAEASIKELLKGPGNANPDLRSIFPEGTSLKKLGQSENIATVSFSSKLKEAKDIDELIVRMAVVNTLTEIDDIKYVSILIEDQELGFQGKPYGPMVKFNDDIQTLWADLQQQNTKNEKPITVKKNITLYFQDQAAKFLLPEIRNVDISGNEYAATIINELIKGPKDNTKDATLPNNLKLVTPPKVEVDAEGKKMMSLNFTKEFLRSMQSGSIQQMLSLGSIVTSITELISDVAYITIDIDGKPISSFIEHAYLKDEKLQKDEFHSFIGKRLVLYFANRDASALVIVHRAVPEADMRYARMILEELMKGPLPSENVDSQMVFTKKVHPNDIKGISIEGDLVKLNFSQNFAKALQGRGSAGEIMTVFSIVNSMTELPNIMRVQFFIEGKILESLGGHISITEPLIRNPGIITVDTNE